MLFSTVVLSQMGFHEFSTEKKFIGSIFDCRSGFVKYGLFQVQVTSSEKQDAQISMTGLMLVPLEIKINFVNEEKHKNLFHVSVRYQYKDIYFGLLQNAHCKLMSFMGHY